MRGKEREGERERAGAEGRIESGLRFEQNSRKPPQGVPFANKWAAEGTGQKYQNRLPRHIPPAAPHEVGVDRLGVEGRWIRIHHPPPPLEKRG